VFVEAVDKRVNGGRIEKGVLADALTHTYDIRINVDNADRRLLPGMVANVTFGAAAGEQPAEQLTLPVTSVQKRADGTLFVWTVEKDSTSHRTPVAIGPTQGNRIVVISGISNGQRIVTEGYQKLSEGTKVAF
jgi:multidrug efflux pump subunit AcrA (membrane-fusion protein)